MVMGAAMRKYVLKLLILLFFFSPVLTAKEFLSPAELEKWFNSDDELPTSKVNDGQLNFIRAKPENNLFHSKINITVDQNSIDHGWTNLTQCYSNLDPIYRTAVTYRKNLIKNLRVISSKNIKHTSVIENKVFLKDVRKDASLCIAATARNFYQNEDQSFSLVNGPYHRKFLDGYYPYRLTLKINYSPKLKFKFNIPEDQKGFQVTRLDNTLSVKTVFEGRLKTEFRFDLKE
jgi:hypothetical protein